MNLRLKNVNPYYLPIHNKVKIEEMFDEDGNRLVPIHHKLNVYVEKIDETYVYNYGDILGDITKIHWMQRKMYSIVQLCEKGYKVRYASNNLEEIYKNYDILIKISPNKLHIFDDVNNKFISYPNVLDI